MTVEDFHRHPQARAAVLLERGEAMLWRDSLGVIHVHRVCLYCGALSHIQRAAADVTLGQVMDQEPCAHPTSPWSAT